MKSVLPNLTRRCLPALLVAAAADSAFGALSRAPAEEPQWLRAQLSQTSVGFYAEAMHDEITTGGSTSQYDRLFFGPSFGFGMYGSIYHPNLMQFVVNGDMSFGWAEEKNSNGGAAAKRSEFDWLGNFKADLFILNGKPYSARLFASQSHAFRDYDFFNSVTVDTWRYGGDFGYSAGPVPVKLTIYHTEEEATGLSGGYASQQTSVSFEARNVRPTGQTGFKYTFTDYQRQESGGVGGGMDQSVGLTDTETFGSHKQVRLNTTLGYSHREYTDTPYDEMNLGANLSFEHTPQLESFYNFNYYRSQSGSFTSDNFSGDVSLQHRLYESLTSTLQLRGVDFSTADSGSQFNTTQYGVNLSEDYQKRIGNSTRLSVSGAIYIDHTDQHSNGGTFPVLDESQTFSGSGLQRITLNLPFVTASTIVVRDAVNPLIVYTLHVDYEVTQNGSLTIIERTALTTIPSGGAVLVSYNATAQPSGSYDTWTGIAQVRLDFFNGLLGVYARLNTSGNNAPPEAVVQDLFAYAFGAEFSWHWLHAGADYECYNSSFSSYRTATAYQTFSFNPDGDSTLDFNFNEAHTEYLDAGRTEDYLSFITRYHRALTSRLGLDVEGGISRRFGQGVEETRATLRPGIQFMMGRLSLKAGYTFEYDELYNNEQRLKHLFFIRASRTF